MPSPAATAHDLDERQYPYWRRNLAVLPVSNLLSSLGFGLAWPFLPLMVRGLGVENNLETWIGNMLLVFYIVSFTMNPIWGGIADHYGRKIMVLRATLGMGFSMLLVAFAPSPLWFAFLLMLIGVFNGSTAASISLIVSNTPASRLGRALALSQTGTLVGQTMGPAVGAMVAVMIPRHHWMFWIGGGILITAGVLVAWLVREVKHLAPGRYRLQWLGPLRELMVVPGIPTLYLLNFLFAAMWTGSVPVMSLFTLELLGAMPEAAGHEAWWLGAVALSLGVSGLIAMPFWGRVLDRHDPARVLMYTTGAAALVHVPLLFLQTPLQLVIARAAFGLAAAAMHPAIMRLLKKKAPHGMDARAIAYATSFQFGAMGIAPFAAGLIGPLLGLRAYFVLAALATAGGLFLWRRQVVRGA